MKKTLGRQKLASDMQNSPMVLGTTKFNTTALIKLSARYLLKVSFEQ